MTSGRRRRSSRRPRSWFERARLSRIHLFIVGGVVLIALVAIAGSQLSKHAAVAPRVSAAPEVVTIQLNAPFGPRFAGAILAENDGLYRAAGVNVKLLPGQGDDDAIRAVVEGQAIVGVADPISVLAARAKGQPLVAFAADYVENAMVFYALAKSNIRAPEDFIGKMIGRVAGSHPAILYEALLNRRGISRSQLRETGENLTVDALVAGTVDVIPGRVGIESYALSQRGDAYRMIPLFDFGIHVPDLVYFTTEKTIRDHPSTLVRLLEGTIAGWGKAYAGVSHAAAVVSEKSDGAVPVAQAEFELAAQRDFVVTVGRRIMEFDELQWKQLVRILTNARRLDEYFDLSRAVNYTLLKDAHRKPISFGDDPGPEPAPLLGR